MRKRYNKKHYIISCYLENNTYSVNMDLISKKSMSIFAATNSDRAKCVAAFETAKIFDGRTVYEAHNEITVLYG